MELTKFLMLKAVECPLLDEDAEKLLEAVRTEYKPIENNDKSMKLLLENLKWEFWERVEKCNMTLQEFHDAKANDEKSRYIITANMKSFMELQSNA